MDIGRICPGCGDLRNADARCPNGCVAGGKTKTAHRLAMLAVWKSPRWAKLRLRILSRDDFTCQRCGHRDTTGRTLVADHRNGFDGPDDPNAWDEEQLQTLCLPCSGRKDSQRARRRQPRRKRGARLP